MTTWAYSYKPTGRPAFFIDSGYVYEVSGGKPRYFIQSGWWYEVDGGAAAFFVEDKTIYSKVGTPIYYLD